MLKFPGRTIPSSADNLSYLESSEMDFPSSSPATDSVSVSSAEMERAAQRRRVQNSSTEGSELSATLDIPEYFVERYRVGVSGLQQLPLTDYTATEYPNATAKIDELDTLRVIDVVEISHPLVAVWQDQVKPPILSILERTEKVRNGWASIDVLRMGYFFDEFGGATPVTVSITVDYGLIRKDWIAAEENIRAFLDVQGLKDVQVKFQRGHGPFPLSFDTPEIRPSPEYLDRIEGEYPERVPMRADFGPEKYFTNGPDGEVVTGPKATIGGYIEILRNQGDWKKYAITSSHCVREAIEGWDARLDGDGNKIEQPVPPDSELHAIDRKGLGPHYAARENITFESPTRRTHRFSLQWHDQEIQKREARLKWSEISASNKERLQLEIEDHRERRARKVKFFDEGRQRFGHLFMCSGFKKRTPDNYRIDIAIIEVNADRIGDNTLPHASSWRENFQAPVIGCGSILNSMASCQDPDSL